MQKVHGPFKLPTTLAIAAFHILAGIAVWQMAVTGFSKFAWIVVAFIYVARAIGVTDGYHRLLAHESYRPKPFFAKLLLAGAAMSLQGSGKWWSKVHIQHHTYTDHPGDPHRPNEYGGGLTGFFWAHMGWMFFQELTPERPAGYVRPAISNEKQYLLDWQKRWYWFFAIGGLLLPAIAGWRALLLGALGLVIGWHITWSVNSVCHVIGDHSVDRSGKVLESRKARNFPLQCLWNVLAIISVGEFRHADHHSFQGSARLGKRWYEIDPGWFVIWIAGKLGWVKDIQRPDKKVLA